MTDAEHADLPGWRWILGDPDHSACCQNAECRQTVDVRPEGDGWIVVASGAPDARAVLRAIRIAASKLFEQEMQRHVVETMTDEEKARADELRDVVRDLLPMATAWRDRNWDFTCDHGEDCSCDEEAQATAILDRASRAIQPPPATHETRVAELESELRVAKLRLQRLGHCPHHEKPEFGCEPCARIVMEKARRCEHPRERRRVHESRIERCDACGQRRDLPDGTWRFPEETCP